MECPKCHNDINDDAAICPFCKKVLLLKCPKCGTFNKTGACSECGFIIISKCNNCGKINNTIDEKCSKCGFSTYKSILLNESETDDYVSFIVSFSNLRELKNSINSVENYNKFYKKLKGLIFNFAKEKKLRATLIDGDFVINFYKDYSFHSCANNAVKSTIEIVNKFVALNHKLRKNFSIALDCKIVILKRSLTDEQMTDKTGLNIKLMNLKNDKSNYLSGIQVIVDNDVQKATSKSYEMSSLYSTQINDKLMSFYELTLSKYAEIPEDDEEEDEIEIAYSSLPRINKTSKKLDDEIDLYDFNKINIETACEFVKSTSVEALQILNSNLKKYRVISLKTDSALLPDTYDIFSLLKKHFSNTIHIQCEDRLKYIPFGIWLEFLKAYTDLERNTPFKLRIRTKLPDTDALLKLIGGEYLDSTSPESERFKYFDAIFGVIKNIEDKLVVFIENVELMDTTSIELLNYILERIDDTSITFLFTTNKNNSLHSKIPALLSYDNYLEVTMKKSDWGEIINTIPQELSEFVDSFYFERIKENYNGSYSYFKNAIEYLKESKTLIQNQNKYKLNEDKIAVLPEGLTDLVQKRIRLLGVNTDAFNIILYSYFLGPKIDDKILKQLGIKNIDKTIKILEQYHFVIATKASVYIQNYRILTNAIQKMCEDAYLKELANNLYDKVYKNTTAPSSIKLDILSILDMKKDMYLEHYNLAKFALGYGDFSAYIKNVVKFFAIIEKKKDSELSKTVDEFKVSVYENVVTYLDTTPDDEAIAVINLLLADAFKMGEDEKIIKLSNITLKNALLKADYPLALISLHNILTRMPQASLLDVNFNYNPKFLSLLLINIEILFNLGELNKCLEITNAILQELTPEVCNKLKPETFSLVQFKDYIFSTLTLSALAKLMTCEKDLEQFLEKIKLSIGEDIPCKHCIITLDKLIRGEKVQFTPNNSEDVYTKILSTLICAFMTYNNDYEVLAKNIHRAKDIASIIYHTTSLFGYWIFCNSFIW